MIDTRQTATSRQVAAAELQELRDKLAALEQQLAIERALAADRAQEIGALHETMRTLMLTVSTTPTSTTKQRWWRRSSRP
jgi:hypothetical protein